MDSRAASTLYDGMNDLLNINLIRFFDFYLSLMFVIGLYRRVGQYRQVLGFVVTGPGRWPRLLELIKQHRMIFLTWTTLMPAFLTLLLAVIQISASRQFWPEAEVIVGQLGYHWIALIALVPLGLAMLAVDVYCAVVVGQFDHDEMSKYFDQAEYWLRSGTAHVVRIFSFGYINPRQTVDVEVRKALVQVSELLKVNLWWLATQTGLRALFGVALWGTWIVLSLRM
jgi:hypothetical protein